MSGVDGTGRGAGQKRVETGPYTKLNCVIWIRAPLATSLPFSIACRRELELRNRLDQQTAQMVGWLTPNVVRIMGNAF